MNEPIPNYRMYSVEQLADALERIDKDRYPDRVVTIKHYLANPGPRGQKTENQGAGISKTTETVLGVFSMELVFWSVLGILALLGYSVW